MVQVNCPRCGRVLPVEDWELCNLFECAGCGVRFYPMMPANEAPPAPPPRLAPVPTEPPRSPSVEAAEREQPVPSWDPSRTDRKRRPRRKSTNWVPLFIILIVLGIVFGSIALAAAILYRLGVFSRIGRPR